MKTLNTEKLSATDVVKKMMEDSYRINSINDFSGMTMKLGKYGVDDCKDCIELFGTNIQSVSDKLEDWDEEYGDYPDDDGIEKMYNELPFGKVKVIPYDDYGIVRISMSEKNDTWWLAHWAYLFVCQFRKNGIKPRIVVHDNHNKRDKRMEKDIDDEFYEIFPQDCYLSFFDIVSNNDSDIEDMYFD